MRIVLYAAPATDLQKDPLANSYASKYFVQDAVFISLTVNSIALENWIFWHPFPDPCLDCRDVLLNQNHRSDVRVGWRLPDIAKPNE